MDILTVSEINAYLRQKLTTDDIIQGIWIKGEISTFKRAASGHCYFSLKEGNAVLRAVMWRNRAVSLTTLPTNGDAVLAYGSISLYESSGDIQLYVEQIQPDGMGLRQAQFEQLKACLEAEGLFEQSRKRPLPILPRRIGVATSAQGAALQDILTVLNRRCPLVEILIAPCLVQGMQAPASIAAALQTLYACDVDVILLVRGGGGLEDLWCFNEEYVARTVFASPVPLITGIGHETDTTIVDYVADMRAPTPSAAAEMAVPEIEALFHEIHMQQTRLATAMTHVLEKKRRYLKQALSAVYYHAPLTSLARARQQVDDLLRRCTVHIHANIHTHQVQLQSLKARLNVLNPRATLARGYALVRFASDGSIMSHIKHVALGERLTIVLQDGTLVVEVKAKEQFHE